MNRRSFFKATLSAGTLAAAPALSKQGDVQIGVCAGTEDLAKAERWGFDYLEPAAAGIAALSAAEFERVRQQVLAARIRCRSFNSLIRTMYVVGSEAILDAVSTYLDSVLGPLPAARRACGGVGKREFPQHPYRLFEGADLAGNQTIPPSRRRHCEIP